MRWDWNEFYKLYNTIFYRIKCNTYDKALNERSQPWKLKQQIVAFVSLIQKLQQIDTNVHEKRVCSSSVSNSACVWMSSNEGLFYTNIWHELYERAYTVLEVPKADCICTELIQLSRQNHTNVQIAVQIFNKSVCTAL